MSTPSRLHPVLSIVLQILLLLFVVATVFYFLIYKGYGAPRSIPQQSWNYSKGFSAERRL
jgi:hypothetical protein